MHVKFGLIMTLLILLKTSAAAQNSSEQIWSEYMLNLLFAGKYNVEAAATYSTVVGKPKWRALDIQLTPEVSLSPHLDLMTAGLVSTTIQNDSLTTFEIRAMLGARVHFTPHNRILTRLLVRFEQRNMQDKETDSWNHSTRSRIRAEAVIPINRKTMYSGDKLWYGLFDIETFLVMDKNLKERFANRFRIRAGLGYRINYGLRLEFVYTLQQSKNTIEGDSPARDSIFRFRLKQYIK